MDPHSPGGPWFGASRVIIDAKVDGLFYWAITHERQSYAHYGRFIRIERPQVAEYTWVSPSTQGLESVVTVSFAARDGGTDVTIVHAGVPDDDKGREHAHGWAFVLASVAERFARKG